MATTKREIVLDMFEMIGLASYEFDLQPEEMDSARKRLDRMMAAWGGLGINMGYTQPTDPNDSDLDEDSGLPDTAIAGVAANLALLVAPGKGKTLSVDVRLIAKQFYNGILAQFSKVPNMQLPDNLPVGAGNKRLPSDLQYFQPSNRVTTGTGQQLDIQDGQEFDAGGNVVGPL